MERPTFTSVFFLFIFVSNLIYVMGKFNKIILIPFLCLLTLACNKLEVVHYDEVKAGYQDRINAGETPFDLINSGVSISQLYGLQYGGGYIFYVDSSYTFVYVATFFPEVEIKWGCSGTSIPGNYLVGGGQPNTSSIVANCSESNCAARFCDDLIHLGYNDWWLPSRDELVLCMDRLEDVVPKTKSSNGLTGSKDVSYWSSTQSANNEAIYVSYTGYYGYRYKNTYMGVTAARKIIDPVLAGLPLVQDRLDGGETPYQIYNSGVNYDSLMGKTYEGGYIFYMDTTDGSGIVAAGPNDVVSGSWGCQGTLLQGLNWDDIGWGQTNTNTVITQCFDNPIVTRECDNLVLNGYSDWYCPSRYELREIFLKLNIPGIVTYTSGYYWSSTQQNDMQAKALFSASGTTSLLNKQVVHYSIPVRTF